MGPCCKSYLSHKFDRPEVIPDGAKMNLASHRVRDSLEIILSPTRMSHECFTIFLFLLS